MEVIKTVLPEHKEICILPLADLHLGDIHSDFRRVREWLDYLAATDNAYCILNGELQSFKPASLDTPVIRLDGTRRRAAATL